MGTKGTAALTDSNLSGKIIAIASLEPFGRHRLLCGDSTVATDVERVLGGVAPHLMVTDPPYGVNYDPAWRYQAACGFETRSQIIWAKNNFAIGRGHYHCKHEPCWYVVRKG